MAHATSLSSLTKQLSSNLDIADDQLNRQLATDKLEQIETFLAPLFIQIRDLGDRKKDFGPLDNYLKGKEIEKLNTRANEIKGKIKVKKDEAVARTDFNEILDRIEECRKDLAQAIGEQDLAKAETMLDSGRSYTQQLKTDSKNRLRILDIPEARIKGIETRFSEAETALAPLRWEKSLEGAEKKTGTRSQGSYFRGFNMCACAAFRGLVAMFSNPDGIKNIDTLLDASYEQYNALLYLKRAERNELLKANPEMEAYGQKYAYGETLNLVDAGNVAPELVSWKGYQSQELLSLALEPGKEKEAVQETLGAITAMIPAGKNRIGRQIKFGNNKIYTITVHKKGPDIFDIDILGPDSGKRYRGVTADSDPATAFLVEEVKKPGGNGTIRICHSDPITEQFLIAGDEKETYRYMLEALSEIMTRDGKNAIGAMFLNGLEFYSVLIRKSDLGNLTVDFFDSHGANFTPLMKKAHSIRFPCIEKAAEFLALRKRCDGTSARLNNECCLNPFYLNDQPVAGFLEEHPLPENEKAAILFDECLKTLADNDPTPDWLQAPNEEMRLKKASRLAEMKQWSEGSFFPALRRDFPVHFTGFAGAIAKASNNPLFGKLEALISVFEELKNIAPLEKAAKDNQLRLLLKDLEAALPDHYKALTEAWLADAKSRNRQHWNQYTPDDRISILKKYVSDQAVIQWISLTHPVRVELAGSYIQRCLRADCVKSEIEKQMKLCQDIMEAVPNAHESAQIMEIQQKIEDLGKPVIELSQRKVSGGLNEENINKLKELQEAYKNLCISFNKAILPFRMKNVSEGFETVIQTLVIGINSQEEETDLLAKIEEMLADLNSFQNEKNLPAEQTAKIAALVTNYKDAATAYNHASITFHLKDYQKQYQDISEKLAADQKSKAISKEDLKRYDEKIKMLDNLFKSYYGKIDVKILSQENKELLKEVQDLTPLIKTAYTQLSKTATKKTGSRK